MNIVTEGNKALLILRPTEPLTSKLLVCQYVQEDSRRLTATDLNIQETHKWHIRSAFSRRGTIETCHGDSECVAYITAW